MVIYGSNKNLEGLNMTNKIKVLIGDDSAEYGVSCANTLRTMGFL